MAVSHILVPVEFSERCIGAARLALCLAHRLKAKVTLFHVQLPEGDPIWIAEHVEQAEERLLHLLPDESIDQDVRRIARVDSDVADAVIDLAGEIGADLIVMPTHGFGAVRRTLMGSVAANVLRDAVCPVWTSAHMMPSPPAEWLDPKRILCAVDKGTGDIAALKWACEIAAGLRSSLSVVRALPVSSNRIAATARADIEKILEKSAVSAQILIEPGTVQDVLPAMVARLNADLLIIGRGSHKIAGELGPHTWKIIRDVSCPVACV